MVANVNIRVEDSLKKNAENIFAELGMSMSTATNVFYKQVVRCGGIPFDLRITDPFYSAENQARLSKTIENYIKSTENKKGLKLTAFITVLIY